MQRRHNYQDNLLIRTLVYPTTIVALIVIGIVVYIVYWGSYPIQLGAGIVSGVGLSLLLLRIGSLSAERQITKGADIAIRAAKEQQDAKRLQAYLGLAQETVKLGSELRPMLPSEGEESAWLPDIDVYNPIDNVVQVDQSEQYPST